MADQADKEYVKKLEATSIKEWYHLYAESLRFAAEFANMVARMQRGEAFALIRPSKVSMEIAAVVALKTIRELGEDKTREIIGIITQIPTASSDSFDPARGTPEEKEKFASLYMELADRIDGILEWKKS